MTNRQQFTIGQRVRKVGGRYGGPGRIVGDTMALDDDGYKLWNVAMKVADGYGEFVHVFPSSALEPDEGTPPAAEPAAKGDEQLKLWFFRDLNDEQRLKLFGLFDLPTKEIGSNHGRQSIALRHIIQAMIKMVAETTAPPSTHLLVECSECHGTGEVFCHADDCCDDLCALNGDEHSCSGKVELCGCATTEGRNQ
jgi:hypothetical protein